MRQFFAKSNGRPSFTPGTYFRLLLIGYFEGIDSERGIAWRAADSLGLREFLRVGLDEETPNHSTISRTRRLIDVETHRKVFLWVLGVIADRGLLKGKTVGGVDATTLEANAAMRSIVRRDNGASTTSGPAIRDRDAHPGGPGPHRPEAQEDDIIQIRSG
jgi:transposase